MFFANTGPFGAGVCFARRWLFQVSRQWRPSDIGSGAHYVATAFEDEVPAPEDRDMTSMPWAVQAFLCSQLCIQGHVQRGHIPQLLPRTTELTGSESGAEYRHVLHLSVCGPFKNFLSFFFKKYLCCLLNIYVVYLASPGCSCSTRDLPSSLLHSRSLIATCKLLVVACGIQFPDPELNLGPLHWNAGFQPLYHQGSPLKNFIEETFTTHLENNLQTEMIPAPPLGKKEKQQNRNQGGISHMVSWLYSQCFCFNLGENVGGKNRTEN